MAILMLLTGSPCSLSFSLILAAQLLDPISLDGFLQCKNLSWNISQVFMVSSLPSTWWGYSPEGGYRESLNSLTSLGSESNAPYWPPTPQPVLFTWDWIDGTAAATLQWPPRGKPVSLLTVPSCELHFWKIIALYCSNQYAQYMLNVYEYTFLFLSFENVRSIFCFLVYVELKKDLKKLSRPKLH